MAVQITGRQIANGAVGVNKLDLSTGTFNFTEAVLQVATPTADSHAATKGYVDSISQGLHWKDSVKVATTANITLSGTQTIDGVAVSADQRVLVKNQSTASDNGIYLCKSGPWVRAADMNAGDEFAGAAVFVQEGTAHGDTGYVCTNDGSVTVGSTAITFVQFTGAGQLSGGNGIDISGSTISIDLDGSTLSATGAGVKISAGGVGSNELADSSITSGKIQNGAIGNNQLANGIGAGKLQLGNGVRDASGSLEIERDGSTLDVGANGIKIAAGGVTNTELAGSIAADKLNLGDGVRNNSGNLVIDLDGNTLSATGAGVKISDSGVDTAQLAADCVTNAKIADDAVRLENLDFSGIFAGFDANGSTSQFELPGPIDLGFKQFFVVTVNGLVMEYKESPDAQDNYKIDNSGTNGVGKITFGSNLSSGDRVTIRGLVNNQ